MSSTALNYIAFDTFVDLSFWHKLAKLKLENYKLNEGPLALTACYENNLASNLGPIISLDLSSISQSNVKHIALSSSFSYSGLAWIFNSKDYFCELDKQKFLDDYCIEHLLPSIQSKAFLKNPESLSKFLLISYIDLKSYQFSFWFAYPAVLHSSQPIVENIFTIDKEFSPNQLIQLSASLKQFKCQRPLQIMNSNASSLDSLTISGTLPPFLCLKVNENVNEILPLESLVVADPKNYLVFCDPSTSDKYPGWPLRNMLYALCATIIVETRLRVICYRERRSNGLLMNQHSLILDILLTPIKDISECKFVGWERYKQKLHWRKLDLANSMDPIKLAQTSVDLNLKLMLWRVMPNLDLTLIKDSKCLLLGAGTLGCNVARQLLVKFVDNSKVSYSNPVRQTLFTFDDAKNNGFKAILASDALKRIHPAVMSEGHVFSIPMPGHPITNSLLDHEVNEKLIETARDACEKLECLINNHDVIFLLLDTREARWLPTLIATTLGKLTLNAALGFDSYLAMRHGLGVSPGISPSNVSESNSEGPTSSGSKINNSLGCYFCNDVVAPADSTRNRSIDQQCTVTRPGASLIAAATLVELYVSILQHPLKYFFSSQHKNLRGHCPAETTKSDDSYFSFIPHQVIDAYKKDRFNFLLRVFQDSDYLEEVSGLKNLKHQALHEDNQILEDFEDE